MLEKQTIHIAQITFREQLFIQIKTPQKNTYSRVSRLFQAEVIQLICTDIVLSLGETKTAQNFEQEPFTALSASIR